MNGDTPGTVVTPAVLRDWPLPMPGDGKESRGHLLVVAGTVTTPGAARLAAEAALRAGAGKLTIATTAPAAATLAVALPEALVEPLPCDTEGSLSPGAADAVVRLAQQADALVVGPASPTPRPPSSCSRACFRGWISPWPSTRRHRHTWAGIRLHSGATPAPWFSRSTRTSWP